MQQVEQFDELALAEVAELPAVQVEDGLVQADQELEALPRNSAGHDPAVVGVAGAGAQAGRFQAVERAGHVRIAGDHAAADLAAGDALRARVRVPAVTAAGPGAT